LLIAPKSGREMRAALREQGFVLPANFDDFIETAKGATSDITGSVMHAVESKKAQVQEAIAHGKETADETRESLEREFAERSAQNDPDAELQQ
jgi:gas vesicle protein